MRWTHAVELLVMVTGIVVLLALLARAALHEVSARRGRK
jgi:hypothetical protein